MTIFLTILAMATVLCMFWYFLCIVEPINQTINNDESLTVNAFLPDVYPSSSIWWSIPDRTALAINNRLTFNCNTETDFETGEKLNLISASGEVLTLVAEKESLEWADSDGIELYNTHFKLINSTTMENMESQHANKKA